MDEQCILDVITNYDLRCIVYKPSSVPRKTHTHPLSVKQQTQENTTNKMKLFIVAVFCFIAAAQAHSLTEEQLAKLKTYKADCIASSGVTPELVEKSKKGEFADDPKLKEFLFCIGKKIGFLNDAGDFQVDVMTAKITANHGKDAADDVVSVCTAKKESSGPETSFALAKCLYEKSKQHITLA